MNHCKHLVRTVLAVLCFGTFAQGALASDPERIRIDRENLAKLSPADQARVLAIADRLETITAMDRSDLTRAERKDLRNETRALRSEANAFNRSGSGTVIYISAGTLIIILLLIIILA